MTGNQMNEESKKIVRLGKSRLYFTRSTWSKQAAFNNFEADAGENMTW